MLLNSIFTIVWRKDSNITPSVFDFATGNKSMEGWSGKGEASVLASRHPSWDEDEEGGGVWNSAGSQGSCSSFNSGGWGHTQGGKRGTIKVGNGFVARSYSLRQTTCLVSVYD